MKPTFFKSSLLLLVLGARLASAQMATCMPGSSVVVTTNAVMTFNGVVGLSNNYAYEGTISANAGGYTSTIGWCYVLSTNDDCQVITSGSSAFNGVLMPTNCTWTASVWDWSTNGTGTNAVFTPATDGTGTLTFNMVWRNIYSVVPNYTNSISASFSVTNPPGEDSPIDLWLLQYFGSLAESATNLDLDGNTLLYDYTNDIVPDVFNFTGVEVANNYVNTSSTGAQLDVAGSPYYVTTLVDDTNFNDAVWSTYSSSSVTVNLGSTEGWHDVWVGLRGHADATNAAVWQWKRLKYDVTPPALTLTSPTNGTVDEPMIQLTGFSPEPLHRISYDLTNAVGLLTNQQVLILDQHYDMATWEFTTNTFQGFDIPLTNGVNTFILHATDLAGNVTTLVTNFTLDYSAKTNPPEFCLTWPTNGTQISGGTFTWDGFVSDPTVTVLASITDTNGTTNTFSGLVERSGKFWVENIPLSGGTNLLTLTVTDAVGNTSVTNISVVQSTLILTMDPVTPASDLWKPRLNLTGTISDATQAVWVNGVKATVSSTLNVDGVTYAWSASNVPTTAGGTASFTITAYTVDEQQPDGSYGN